MGKASAYRAGDTGVYPRLTQSSPTSDVNVNTLVAALPGAWHYRFSTGAGWPSVSIPLVGERASLICNSGLRVGARKKSSRKMRP